MWSATDEVWQSGGDSGPGAFVVLSGVVKRVYVRPDGSKKVSPRLLTDEAWSFHSCFFHCPAYY